MKINLKKIALLLSFSLLIFSCSKVNESEILETKSSHTNDVLNYIKSLGILQKDIVDVGNKFIVDGDIIFSKDMIVPKHNKLSKIDQFYSGDVVNLTRQSDIRILVDPSMISQNSEISSAVNLWNNVNSNLHFNIVTAGDFDILITSVSNTVYCGQGQFPSNGNPGNNVNINLDMVKDDNYDQRTVNIAHELGHCIGFLHSNSSGTEVPGWGGTDDISIMLGNTCHDLCTQLSNKDVGATHALYPLLNGATNTQIQIDPYGTQFIINWDLASSILISTGSITGYDISYSGFSGANFGGNSSVSGSSNSFTVPNVNPYPTSNSNTGGIQITIKAKYNNGLNITKTVSRNKVGGVWQ